jgi:hypothetical protein
VYAMDNLKQALKENIKLIIIAVIIIAIALGVVIYNNLTPTLSYNPEIDEYNDVEYVKKNYEVNEYSVINMSEYDLLNAYLKKYVTLEVTNPDKAYEMLSDKSKESFDNDVSKYKEYISGIISINTKENTVTKYRDGSSSNQIEIIDSESNKYIITEYAIWDIEITLNGRE